MTVSAKTHKNILRALILFSVALSLSVVFSCEVKNYAGIISIRGNAPFSKLVLATDDGALYELVGERAKELMSHQYARVVIAGKEIYPAKGPGFPAKLEVINILSISAK